VLTLLFLLIVLVAVVSLVSGATRRRRRAFEAEQARQEEEARAGGDGDQPDPFGGMSPFGMLPFGGLLESLMSGMGARSFRWDETTGQWVEMSDEMPEPMPAPEAELDAPNGDAPARRTRARTKPRTASMGSFGGLLGGSEEWAAGAASSRFSLQTNSRPLRTSAGWSN